MVDRGGVAVFYEQGTPVAAPATLSYQSPPPYPANRRPILCQPPPYSSNRRAIQSGEGTDLFETVDAWKDRVAVGRIGRCQE